MAALNYTPIKLAGTAVTPTAADALGDTIQPNDRGFIYVKNGDATGMTVTIVTPGFTQFGVDQPDVTITVGAGLERYIGPLTPSLVNDTDNAVRINYSKVTAVTRAAISI